MNRIIEFTLQSKGGVGKSFHTYFRALSVPDEHSLFVDVDSSTQTSTRQLKFLGADRLETISLLDNRDVLVRDTFLGYMESLSESSFEKIYMDFGAPESEQIPALIQRDIPFREFCEELGFEIVLNIVIGGGGAYKASVNYLQKMVTVLKNEFMVVAWENITSFNQFPALSTELAENCKQLEISYKRFGDFDPSTLLGGQVLDGIRRGYSINEYGPGARIRIKKELKENFSNE
jgi:hypothetical protein